MEHGDRWRIVQKPVNRSCQSPRCDIRSGDGNGLGRRLGPLAEDFSRSAVIEAHDWCSQSKRLGETQSRFLMEGWVEQCSRGGEARQHRTTRDPSLEMHPVSDSPSSGDTFKTRPLVAVTAEDQTRWRLRT